MAARRVPQALRKDRSDQSNPTDLTDLNDQERFALYSRWLESSDPAMRANTLICLIN